VLKKNISLDRKYNEEWAEKEKEEETERTPDAQPTDATNRGQWLKIKT
jgi:hypothetical protein